MTTEANQSILHAARAWAQTATPTQIERAHRLFGVATDVSNPLVVLRVLFRTDTAKELASLVESFFDGAPTRTGVNVFLREVVATRPRLAEKRPAATVCV